MKQISLQLSAETERQMAQLAVRWELPSQRHVTAIMERVVAMMTLLESVDSSDESS